MSDAALVSHLAHQLGEWPPHARCVVTTSTARRAPGWDGRVRRFAGLRSPLGTVVSVPSDAVAPLRAHARDLDELRPHLEARLGGRVVEVVFRTTTTPAPLEPLGEWVPADDARVPAWLRPFGGDVLVALDDGRYLAGVGLKRHDKHAWEISVGTDEHARGHGLARRLVATAARRVLDEGRAVTYLHEPANAASARVAQAAGFADLGWRALDLASPTDRSS